MMKQYQLAMPQQVFSGETGMQALESLAARHKKAAVFTDAGIRASGVLERPLAELDKAAVPYVVYDTLPAEPTCDQAQQVIDTFRESGADLIVAVGGGSVMDIAKLASITADGSCTVRDQLKDPRIGRTVESRHRQSRNDRGCGHSGRRDDPSPATQNRSFHRHRRTVPRY